LQGSITQASEKAKKTMLRSLCLSVALLSIILLMSPGSVSARSEGTLVPHLAESGMQLKAVDSAVNHSQAMAVWANPTYSHNGENGQGNNNQINGPVYNPEPSTILWFGAALLIGAGVVLSRRLSVRRK
jgi:hypothetical protein